ncbi:peptidoglycan-binding protein, partial [bacterium]|nr:peptidoglycan-binding protein [bacterium]
MTSFAMQQHPDAGSRSLRRLMARTMCVSAIVVLGYSAVAVTASAAPGALVEAPLMQSGFAGLRVGAYGSDVVSLQRALIAAGINVPGGADGKFGPATRQAVVRFQTAQSLPATGEVDQVTSNALASSRSGSSSSGETVLAQGARGDAVKDVQRRLAARGVYVAGGADGVYGAATVRAVTQFQRWNGLTPTGAVDGKTAAALGIGSSSSPSTPAPTAPPVVASSNPYVGLRQGASGARVKELQAALQNSGVVVRGGADGAFGPATTKAVKAFQAANGISQTGVLTEQGAEILNLGTGEGAATPPAASSPYLGLAVGARGQAVKDVQQALIAAGVTVRGGADGAFGNATKAALISYQTSAGVTA